LWRRRKTNRRRIRILRPATPPTTLPATAPGEIASLLPDEGTGTPAEDDVADAAAPVAWVLSATAVAVVKELVSAPDADCVDELKVLGTKDVDEKEALDINMVDRGVVLVPVRLEAISSEVVGIAGRRWMVEGVIMVIEELGTCIVPICEGSIRLPALSVLTSESDVVVGRAEVNEVDIKSV